MSAIEAAGLVQRFGDVVALHPLDLSVAAGERVAVLGDNGAGKTTLLRILATASRPEEGSLRLLGLDPVRDRDQVRRRLGYVAHQPGLYPALTALENLAFFCDLRGLPRARAAAVLDAIGLGPHGSVPPSRLSRGLQQRLAIGRALLHDPELLVLDEPDASLDEPGRALLHEIAEGRTLVMATHDQQLAAALCGRAITLRAGRVLQVAPSAHLGAAR